MTWRTLLPNSLTLTRLGLAPAFPFVPAGWRLPILVIALVTEFLDGQLARRLHGTSDFGRVLDPIADKLFVLSVMLVLIAEGLVSPSAIALVMFRDIVILASGAWFFFTGGKREQVPRVQATLLGQVTTAFQIVFLIGVLVFERSDPILLLPTAALSLGSAADYLRLHGSSLLPSRRKPATP